MLKKILIAVGILAVLGGAVYQVMNPTEYKHPFAR